MDDATAVHAVLVPPQLARLRRVCRVDGAIEPRFDGYTQHVLLAEDRAFLIPRTYTLTPSSRSWSEGDVYATVGHPLVPGLLGRWHEPGISPYPFFAVTRLAGRRAYRPSACPRSRRSSARRSPPATTRGRTGSRGACGPTRGRSRPRRRRRRARATPRNASSAARSTLRPQRRRSAGPRPAARGGGVSRGHDVPASGS
jgi:hypothetical protein